ncbi:hypothetical protein HII31_05935 [Pseudocercospora fuligena]|uniref:Chitin-binding type-4 domain-containing protein n=1 Tax=Pseudocercospora fuligena TaxID=685502 RepID=A0A8H6RKJ2_9PEZI|nr:hypothetical protein HII31_05935 [Pseudocercospora fuligena]
MYRNIALLPRRSILHRACAMPHMSACFSLLLILPAVLGTCLTHEVASGIVENWSHTFDTDNAGNGLGEEPSGRVLSDGSAWDQEGMPGFPYNGNAEFSDSNAAKTGEVAILRNQQQAVLHWFCSCDEIFIRWQMSGETGNVIKNMTAPIGTEVAWKGMDWLQVNVTSRTVYNATSSSNIYVMWKQVGYTGYVDQDTPVPDRSRI